MAYNYFPTTYQSPYVPQYQPQQQGGGIIWVQGEAGAKSYFVPPNTTVQLWDSEAQVIYLKSTDASGMPSLKVLDYTIRGGAAPKETPPEYATVAALDDLKAEIESLKERLNDENGGKKA